VHFKAQLRNRKRNGRTKDMRKYISACIFILIIGICAVTVLYAETSQTFTQQFNTALRLYNEGKYEESMRIWESLIESYETTDDVTYYLEESYIQITKKNRLIAQAVQHIEEDKLNKAEEILNTVDRTMGGGEYVDYWLSYIKQIRAERAKQAEIATLFTQAADFEHNKRLRKALSTYQKITEMEASNSVALREYTRLFNQIREIEIKHSIKMFLASAHREYDNHNYKKAIVYCNKVFRLDVHNESALLLLENIITASKTAGRNEKIAYLLRNADTERREDNLHIAQLFYRQVLALDNNNSVALSNIAKINVAIEKKRIQEKTAFVLPELKAFIQRTYRQAGYAGKNHLLSSCLSVKQQGNASGIGEYPASADTHTRAANNAAIADNKEMMRRTTTRLLQLAQGNYIKGDYYRSIKLCEEVLKSDPTNDIALNMIRVVKGFQQKENRISIRPDSPYYYLHTKVIAYSTDRQNSGSGADRFSKCAALLSPENNVTNMISRSLLIGEHVGVHEYLDNEFIPPSEYAADENEETFMTSSNAVTPPSLLSYEMENDAEKRMQMYYLQAQMYFMSGDYTRARLMCQEILKIDPKNHKAKDLLNRM